MGLDMYAFITTTTLKRAVDFQQPDDAEEIHYWRKHSKLHDWMEVLYFRKGGQNEEFNLAGVELDSVDLDRLEADVKGRRLLNTDGRFFRISDGSEIEDDLAFIADARVAIADGKTVHYVAFW